LSASTQRDLKGQEPVLSWELRSGDEKVKYGPYGGLNILIFPGATQAVVEDQYQDALDETLDLKTDLAKRVKDKAEWVGSLKSSSSAEQEELAKYKHMLDTFDEGIHPMDFGLPDRRGYARGKQLFGFLWRDGVYYHFAMSSNEYDKRTVAEREAWFSDFMKRFQPRKLYEIPKERGVCVPYGFIPDDGTVPFHTAAGIRFDDRPNVLYVLRTQVVDERPITNTLLEATSRASVGLMPGFANEEVAKLIKKRVGPHRAYIGELAAEQGGAAVQLTEGKRKFDNYSVFTGYNGWMNSHVLPFIAVDMRSFTQAQTERSRIERLKTDPPPFEESKARLDAMLKSIRLRPTTPPMAELQ
jgi:hypothetical protein